MTTTPQTPVDALMALVDRYWELAYAEGKEGRDHDTEAGEAQAVLSEIRSSARALAAIPEQQAGGVPAGRKLIGWRTSDYLMETDDAAKAKSWANHLDVLPIFEGDENTKLAASPSPSAVQPLSEAHGDVRVACITLDGSTLYIPAKEITDFGIGDDDGETYTLTFKTMTRAEFEALGEFDGF